MDPGTTPSSPLLALDSRCDALRSPDYLNLSLSLLILIGILISYLPQHYRIVSRRSSEGISPWFILLGCTSATAGLANILTVPPSRADIACCKEVETAECLAGLLGIAQLGVQWVCVALILVLFLVFFRSNETVLPEEELTEAPPKWGQAVAVGAITFVHGLAVIALTGVFAIALRGQLTYWANFLGIMAAALAAVQYIPQIYTTYHLKHVGSLSIPMMCIQTPGGFLFALNLWLRLGLEGWSTWGIYLLTASMQGILLIMAIYYELAARSHDETSPAGGHLTPEQPASRPTHPNRTYSEGWVDGLPGPYTAHPERYADTEEELERLLEREERQVLKENRPLLKPGGIGTPHRSYDTNN